MSETITDTTTERLRRELSDPVTKQEAADVLHVGLASVYASVRSFDAARLAGDVEAMRRYIPCLHQGGVVRSDGTYHGGRYVIPRDAFIRWYISCGLDPAVIEELYGKQAP